MALLRVALAQVDSTVGDLAGNAATVLARSREAAAAGADLVAFPEMHLTGYPLEDLALRPALVRAARRTVRELDRLLAICDQMDALTATVESRWHMPNVAQFVADDNAFHLTIARASRNPHLLAAVETARAEMFLPIGAVFDRLEDNANDFHREIVDAIRQQDGDAAEDAMRRHIISTRDCVQAFIGRHSKDVTKKPA